jgi:U3 small nucleolar RNA-associated protein 25
MDDGNSTTTRLITLLNISAVKTGKRKRLFDDDSAPVRKLNKRKSVLFADALNDAEKPVFNIDTEGGETVDIGHKDVTEENESQGALVSCCTLQNY